MKKALSIFAIVLVTTFLHQAAFAEDFKNYAVERCGFEIGLPETPQIAEETSTSLENKDVTQDRYMLTHVFDAKNILVFSAVCRTLSEKEAGLITEDLLRNALDLYSLENGIVTAGSQVENSADTGNLSAVLIGSRRENPNSFLTSQYWVGNNSVLMFELELKGTDISKHQDMFSDILTNIKAKK